MSGSPVKHEDPVAKTPPTSPGHVDVAFPPDEEGVSTLIGYCDKGELPAYFGGDVSLEQYNDWLQNKEDGLRVTYDVDKKKVLLREGCLRSHGTTRLKLINALEAAYAPYNYFSGLGQIETPDGMQNVTPDGVMASGPETFPVLAEVGQSQTEDQLTQRANVLLGSVPGARVVVLVKIFDTNDPQTNGRMVAWCATHDATGNISETAKVEFGRLGPGGVPRNPWAAGTPVPVLTVPAHDAIPATNVSLDGILTGLRAGGGAIFWKHPPGP